MQTSNMFRSLWNFGEGVTPLNHGSFGACPAAILDLQQKLRTRMENATTDFFVREAPPLLAEARTQLASFLGADAEGLSFVPNATSGVNAVLRSLKWNRGDEIVTTNLIYPACRNALGFIAERYGVIIKRCTIPYPPVSEQQLIEGIQNCITPETKLALIDHVTSSTALILPVQQIIHLLHEKGITVLVDGAHAPGMVELNLCKLNPDWYTGNCHKWLCAPKGSAFLYTAPQHRKETVPLSISNNFYSSDGIPAGYRAAFDWTGTADLTPYLCVPESIRYLASVLPGGWDAIRARNHQLLSQAAPLVAQALHTKAPELGAMTGSMLSLVIPGNPYTADANGLHPLGNQLWEKHRIETLITCLPDGRAALRLSAHIYNDIADYIKLAEAISLHSK